METMSTVEGSFVFVSAPEGLLVLSAHKGAMQSSDVEATSDNAHGPGDSRGLVLTLNGDSSALAAQAMEFSDSPSFSIAAVTDWTAAGGHGSDAILRTSESLNRDAARLKGPDANVVNKTADVAMNQAMGLEAAGEYVQARRIAGEQLAKKETADWLRVAGELDEKLGNSVAAVNKLERAAHEDGSEANYFAWGAELLLHRAIWQAKAVFSAGVQRYPRSARMLTALGAALFSCSLYDDAAQRLCEAADLEPDSAEPYVFLGKAEFASPNPLQCSEEKLAEFAKRMPENPRASYFYAMALWKHSGRSTDPGVLEKVEALLKRALELDPECSDAYLQLGNLNASRHEGPAAIANYQKAIQSNPDLAEAHYRLGLAYDRAGEKAYAAREFAIHEKLDKEQAAEVERERREVKQFLVQGSGNAANP
jgi:tetratricopeptide (TPR) repeat protein